MVAAGELMNSSRIGALAADRHRLGRCVRSAARRDSLDRATKSWSPGSALQPGQIYDINRFTLSAVVSDNGGVPVVVSRRRLTRSRPARARSTTASTHDIVVFSGGSSVGERDLIRDAIAAKGQMLFHGVAVKPGKPTGLGVVVANRYSPCPAIPTSCLSNAHMLLVPMLRRIARLGPRDQQHGHACRSPSALRRPRDGISSIRCGSKMATAVPAFKARATSRACRVRTDISRFPPTSNAVEAGTSVDVTLF